MRQKVLLAVVFVFVSTGLVAEEVASVVPGARVRITAPSVSPTRVIGQVLATNWDTLLLQHKPSLWFSDADNAMGTLRISFDSLEKLEMSQGSPGAAMGGTLGFFAGLGFVGLLSATDMLGAGHEYELALIFIAPISVATGTVLGAIIGRSEKWEEVPLVRLGIMPQGPNRAMLSASFRF